MRMDTACPVLFSPAGSPVKRRALTRHDLAIKLRQWITIDFEQLSQILQHFDPDRTSHRGRTA